MAIQIIITGDHATDAIAELQNLSHALGGANVNEPTKNTGKVLATSAVHEKVAAGETVVVAPVKTTNAPADNKLSREDQDAAVASMIDNGEKDERYDLLTKGRQKAVDDGIAAKLAEIEAGAPNNDLDDMFGDDEKPAEEPVATADTVRDLMGKLGKDKDGNPIQENLLKIRDILTKYVTKGKEIKVGNIPEAKFKEVVAELKKIAA